jgi:hypothetical protein
MFIAAPSFASSIECKLSDDGQIIKTYSKDLDGNRYAWINIESCDIM